MPYYRLFFHFVWATKERLPMITDDNREAIFRAMAAKVKKEGGIVHALNGMADHVHLVATAPPDISLATFIGRVKGSSSFVASRLPNAITEFTWQREYGVLSVSESHLPTVIDYVRRQQEHHAQNQLDPRLEKF